MSERKQVTEETFNSRNTGLHSASQSLRVKISDFLGTTNKDDFPEKQGIFHNEGDKPSLTAFHLRQGSLSNSNQASIPNSPRKLADEAKGALLTLGKLSSDFNTPSTVSQTVKGGQQNNDDARTNCSSHGSPLFYYNAPSQTNYDILSVNSPIIGDIGQEKDISPSKGGKKKNLYKSPVARQQTASEEASDSKLLLEDEFALSESSNTNSKPDEKFQVGQARRIESPIQKNQSRHSLEPRIETKKRADSSDLYAMKGSVISWGGIERSKMSYQRRESGMSSLSNDFAFKTSDEIQAKWPLITSNSTLGFDLTNNFCFQEDTRFLNRNEKLLACLKQKALFFSRFNRFLNLSNGIYDAFYKIKGEKGDPVSFIRDSVLKGLETTASRTVTEFPLLGNGGFALNLDQITEIDSPEVSCKNRSKRPSSRNQVSDSYGVNRIQQRMVGLLLLERVYSKFMRKIYRTCFEKIANYEEDLDLSETGDIQRYPGSGQEYGSSDNNISCDSKRNALEIDEERVNLYQRGRKKNLNLSISEKNGSIATKRKSSHTESSGKGKARNNIANLEGRLEQSLERKLEAKIDQNLDEKLRGKLEQALMALLGHDLSAISQRYNESSHDRNIQTERALSTLDSFRPRGARSVDKTPFSSTVRGVHERCVTEPVENSRYLTKFAQPLESPIDVKSSWNLSEIKGFTKKKDLPSFVYESPTKVNRSMDDTNLLSSAGVKFKDNLHYSPISHRIDLSKRIPSREEDGGLALFPQDASPIRDKSGENTERTMSDHMIQTLIEDKSRLFRIAFKKGSAESSRKLQFFYLIDKILRKRTNECTWEAFRKLKSFAIPSELNYSSDNLRLNHFTEPNKHSQSKSFDPYPPFRTNAHSDYTSKENRGYETLRLSSNSQESSHKLSLSTNRLENSYSEIWASKLESQKKTLNYLVFAKRIEKLYKSKLRTVFTRLCFHQRTGGVQSHSKFDLKTFLKKLELRIKKSSFGDLRTHAARVMNLENKLGKLVSFVQHKMLKSLSEAFYLTASFGLLRREYQLNLTLMSIQISEMKKSRLRSAFVFIKQSSENNIDKHLGKLFILKKILRQKSIRQRFMLKNSFVKWRGTAANLSVSILHEATKLGHEKALKAYLLSCLKGIFNSKIQVNKFFAFYKLKHYSKNQTGALNLYGMLDKKLWNRLRLGFEAIARNEKKNVSHEVKFRKLDKLSELATSRLSKAFMNILIYSKTSGAMTPQFGMDQKRAILHLSGVAENLQQNMLLHGFKMLELYNIHKRNQKNLYINLALKIFLLVEERKKSYKKYFMNMLALNLEKGVVQQMALEKLLRRGQNKNLAHFFNRFKSEIINIKLNHSIVNLAIKDIILAIEKLCKVQRGRKALVFKKLNLFLWEKQQQLYKEDSTMTAFSEKQPTIKENINTIKGLSSIGSIDFTPNKSIEEEPTKRLLRFIFGLERSMNERKRIGFKAIQSIARVDKLKDLLKALGKRILMKTLYKRYFLAFVQIRYIVEKRQQKVEGQKSVALLKILKNLDRKVKKTKKVCLKNWRLYAKLENQFLQEKLDSLAKIQSKACFKKFKLGIQKSIQEKAEIHAGLLKMEEITENTLESHYLFAFENLKEYKIQLPSIKICTEPSTPELLSIFTPRKTSSKKLKKSKTISVQSPTKVFTISPSNFFKKSANKASITASSKVDTPSNSQKKAANKPTVPQGSTNESPRLRRSDSTASKNIVKTVSLTSSNVSSKVTTPSHFNKSGKK